MPDTTTDAQEQADRIGQSWEYLAWRMWCAGTRNLSAIARSLQEMEAAGRIDNSPHDHRNVKRAIQRESKLAREALDGDETDALMEYIAGLEEQFGEADRLMRTGDNDNAKLGGLKVKVDLLAKLAAAKGVVTERKAEQHSGTLAITNVDVAAVVDNAAAATAACVLLDALGHSADDTGGAGETRSALPVPSGAAPLAAEPEAHGSDSGPDAPPHGDDAAAPREE
jgi:hypothetical protein